jgi:hypothetical protein
MRNDHVFTSEGELERDLALLEHLRQTRKEFSEQVCAASKDKSDKVLDILQTESTYHFAEFFYQLRARKIEKVADVQALVELHEQYVIDLQKDSAKMSRIGLKEKRVMNAMFTSDTKPRLLETWSNCAGTIDQSNLGRLMFMVMADETCAKIAKACAMGGFVDRKKSPFGTMLIRSNGTLEQIFGNGIRQLRLRIKKGK